VQLLKSAAQIHDIGKLGIKEEVLHKETGLTDDEWKEMREHPAIGEDMLKPISLDKEVLAVVRSHHERYDGKGYPDRLDGKHTNIFAQIISVADAYDAMTSRRPYKPILSKAQAMEELKAKSGTQFNADIVNAFLGILSDV
jgi:HD-GYP domain-containing protein (c-di-GMP phosphodiesterase class II)